MNTLDNGWIVDDTELETNKVAVETLNYCARLLSLPNPENNHASVIWRLRDLIAELGEMSTLNHYGVDVEEMDAASICLREYLLAGSRALYFVVKYLTDLGFAEDVARYAYREAIKEEWAVLHVSHGKPVLMLRGAQS